MQTNLLRLFILLIYPIILLFSFFIIYRKYKDTIEKSYIQILINTIIISIVIMGGLLIFFHYEDTIYSYDYAGHWIRSLTLRDMFYSDPANILPTVYKSMNYDDYSYLPALFMLPLMLIKTGYTWFSLCNYICFLLPIIILLQILYFRYFDKYKFLPLILIAFYPLYLPLFYGKIDSCGLFFITIAYALIILPKFEDIDYLDCLSINLLVFLAIFLRRWYVYSAICLYMSFLIKWLLYKDKKTKDILKLVSSGIVALVIVIIFFMPFVTNSIGGNFEEAYSFYNNDGKIYSLFNYISPVICLVCILGIFNLFRKNKTLLLINILSIIIPCLLVWKIQSFEFHHYYIFLLNIIILFINGIELINNLKLITLIFAIMFVQTLLIFSSTNNTMPFFSNIRKTPEVLSYKEELIDISSYLKSIEVDNDSSAFVAAGSYGIITDDLLRNALLPSLDYPNIDSSVFDIRDGFPKDFQFIKYIITVDPIVYTDKDYQHMFDVIDYAIKNVDYISEIYNPIYTKKLGDKYNIVIYERTSDLSPEIKQYFYDEMLKYYPDKEEYFAYILD